MAYIMRGIKKAQDIECIIEKEDEIKDLNPNYKIKILLEVDEYGFGLYCRRCNIKQKKGRTKRFTTFYK